MEKISDLWRRWAYLIGLIGLLAGNLNAHEFEGPPGFEAALVGQNLGLAVGFQFAADGTALFVEKGGLVWYFDGTERQNRPFIDLRDEVNLDGDRGLLAVALHPGFVPDGGPTSWVYLLYTVSPVFGEDRQYNEDDMYSFSRLTRYLAITDIDGSVVADGTSRHVLLGNQLPDGTVPDGIASLHASHSNGSLIFGTDGSLLLSTGDGAHFETGDVGGLDPQGFDDFVHPVTGLRGPMPKDQDSGSFRSQDLRSLAGKVLRIDPATGFGLPSNPFFDGDPSHNASRVWALGLRNPFRMALVPGTGSSDPALADPGELILGDVGRETWEEIDRCRGGENFRWPCWESYYASPDYNEYDAGGSPYAYLDCADAPIGVPTEPLIAWHHLNSALYRPPGTHFDFENSPLAGFDGMAAIGGPFYVSGPYPPEYDGRYFMFDYAFQWMKSVEFDAQGDVLAVREFATGLEFVGGERHPITGEIFLLALNNETGVSEFYRLTYDPNASPVAVAAAEPRSGPAPLQVSFDSGGSFDPEGGALLFEWDFGDGSPVATAAVVDHLYATEGVYDASLQVTDPLGRTAADSIRIAVGSDVPVARILSPSQGQVFAPSEAVALLTDVEPDITATWTVAQFHDTHVHPAFFQSTQASDVFVTLPHGDAGELYYYRVCLNAMNPTGLQSTSCVYIYPHTNILDVAGEARIISRLDELFPPEPQGAGNPDVEVIRDDVRPAVGSMDPSTQFDSMHGGDQGTIDWIGYELDVPLVSEKRFVSLTFQEGLHFEGGGWMKQPYVDVRSGGFWTPVEDLVVEPAYPSEFTGQPGFNGRGFETYVMRFAPAQGDAIRLRGQPGGSERFISVGELRVEMITEVDPSPNFHDITDEAQVIGRVFELDPPGPTGGGNPDPETIRNGTTPAVGSTSAHAQFDTFHDGDQAGVDWIGYRFDEPRLFRRLVFQEGLHSPQGGRFTSSLRLQVRNQDEAPWVNVQGFVSSPPYPGSPSFTDSYETFVFDFPAISGRSIRLAGQTEGPDSFISVGELRVLSPGPPPPCAELPSFQSVCTSSPSSSGLPARASAVGCSSVEENAFVLAIEDAPVYTSGIFFYGNASLPPMPFGDGFVCVGGDTGRLNPPFQTDMFGHAQSAIDLDTPPNVLVTILPGSTWYFQGWYRDEFGPGGSGFNTSDAIEVTFEP